MDNKRQKWVDRLLAGAKALPLLLILLVILFFGQNLDKITVEDILRYTPQNLLLAALVLVGAYAVKSLSVVFPLLALYASAGVLFPPPVAILVKMCIRDRITSKPFGHTGAGEPVKLYTLTNASGAYAEILDYGCRVRALFVPDRQGVPGNVVLGHATLEEYEHSGTPVSYTHLDVYKRQSPG